MNVRDAVTTTARDLGYGYYTPQISDVARMFEQGESNEAIVDRIVGFGASSSVAREAVSRVRSLTTEPVDTTVTPDGAFDRAHAAAVIRVFIQQGADRYVGHDALYEEEDVDALLILAGLEDEPEPEPEIEEPEIEEIADVEPGALRRLLSWARGQGFSG